jgi:hypothetical protein
MKLRVCARSERAVGRAARSKAALKRRAWPDIRSDLSDPEHAEYTGFVRLTYTVHEAGWATVAIACGSATVEMSASYLHDSLRDLLSGAKAIASGASDVTVVFMDEPGEHHLNVRRLAGGRVTFEVNWFDDWQNWGFGGSSGKTVLSCETTIAHLHGQVLSAARAIIDGYGIEGYRQKWRAHDFPVAQYEDLRSTTPVPQ